MSSSWPIMSLRQLGLMDTASTRFLQEAPFRFDMSYQDEDIIV